MAAASPLVSGGLELDRVRRVDVDQLHPALATVPIGLACDVDNPLTGASGAAVVYGPQTGATETDVSDLDRELGHWADVVASAIGADHRDFPGAGAAGGVGFGAIAVLGARPRPGIELVLEMLGFDDALASADLVVTGEGCLDEQTLRGKAPAGVAIASRAAGVPVVAVVGESRLSHEISSAAGPSAVYDLVGDADTPDVARTDPAPLLELLGAR
jgi:glycerate kinase